MPGAVPMPVQEFIHTGVPQGSICLIDDIQVYMSGLESSKKVLIVLPDAVGFQCVKTQLVIDNFAQYGYLAILIELYWDCYDSPADFDVAKATVNRVLAKVKEHNKPDFIAAVGYSSGAVPVVDLLSRAAIDAGAIAYPNFVSETELLAIKKPIIIAAAESDENFTASIRHRWESVLTEMGAKYYVGLFSKVSSGFATGGDPDDFWEKLSKEKAFEDQLWFFKLFSTA